MLLTQETKFLLTPALITRSKKDWQYIILHHSWSPDNKVTSDWEAIRRYHTQTLGWSDIGYHFGLEYVNNILVLRSGRSLETAGAHTIGLNETGIGICLIGNYDTQIPVIEQILAVEELCKTLMNLYDLTSKHILGHFETYDLRGKPREKTCPGLLFVVNKVRENLLENGVTSGE